MGRGIGPWGRGALVLSVVWGVKGGVTLQLIIIYCE